MTSPTTAAGTTTKSGVFTGIPTQQSCGVTSKRTGAARRIHGHCTGRVLSHAGIVSGSIGANVRSHHGNAVAAAIAGPATISPRLATTKTTLAGDGENAIANQGARAPAIVAASRRLAGTVFALKDATVMTTAARTDATHASIGRPPSRAAARKNSAPPRAQPAASCSQSDTRSSAEKTGSRVWDVANAAEAKARLPATRSAAMAAR
ncbi:MAG TPA: hypothetical protein VGR46_13455 [Candidatus Limnocylindria bacterium]|jgi:hypothetical protein|nr:hypothetical protein [Candidatus Limnocylindria bacterium]